MFVKECKFYTNVLEMCIILTTDMKPKSTRLLTIEVQPIIPVKWYKRPRAHLIVYDNDVDINGARFAEKRQLMVVPFPNPDRLLAEMVVFQDRQAEEAIFDLADKLVPRTSWSNSLATRTRSISAHNTDDTMITVQQVGGYKASVALDYSELTSRIKWDQFQLPIHFDDLLRDLRERFGTGFGFIVAEPNRAPDGQFGGAFAWVYHSQLPCLPTAHEKSSRSTVQYNVKAYAFSDGRMRATWSNSRTDHMDVSVKAELNVEMASHLSALLKTARFTRTKTAKLLPIDLTYGLRVDIQGDLPINDHVYIKRNRNVRFDLDKNTVHLAPVADREATQASVTDGSIAKKKSIHYAFIIGIIAALAIILFLARSRIFNLCTTQPNPIK